MRNLAEHRRDIAEKDLGSTLVRPSVCVISIVIFAMVLLSVSICQSVSEIRRGKFTQVLRTVELFSDLKREAFEKYEDILEEESVLTNWLLPNVQTIFTELLRTGNEQVYLGGDGWLFYRADIDSLITSKENLSPYSHEVSNPKDALDALVDFKDQLKTRDIMLIVMPTPVKPSIHPEMFSPRLQQPTTPIHHPTYSRFVERLASQGVLVYDLSSYLFEAARREPQYLKTDSHWNPAAMERVAKHLAEYINKHIDFDTVSSDTFTNTAANVTNVGDIARMLNLSELQSLFPQEEVTTHVIRTQSGELWQPNHNAEILFLGDSFSNIYSLDGMGWGESAGFVEHLSAELSRPIDKIVINDGGAFATRHTLVKEPNRLNGKRVVVYQFATRELHFGNWELLQIPEISFTSEDTVEKSTRLNEEITINAFIKDKTEPPLPRSVPYSECIIALHLEKIDNSDLPDELVVFVWGMRKNKWTDAATYKIGQNVKLKLRPWDVVQADYESYNRIELENEDAWLLDVYWGEIP